MDHTDPHIHLFPDETLVHIFMFLDILHRFVGRNVCRRWAKCMPFPTEPQFAPFVDMIQKRGGSHSFFLTIAEESQCQSEQTPQPSMSRRYPEILKKASDLTTPTTLGIPASFPQLAAYQGHAKLLQWLEDVGHPPDYGICSAAALGGHFGILQKLREKGASWGDTCSAAALAGHLNIVKWAFNSGTCPTNDMSRAAVLSGRIEVAEWCIDHDPLDKMDFFLAAAAGDLTMIQWLRGHSKVCDRSTHDLVILEGAASMGRLKVLQWAIDNGIEWTSGVLLKAAKYGHLSVILWAYDKGFLGGDVPSGTPNPIHELTINSAIHGHLGIPEWFLKNELCSLDEEGDYSIRLRKPICSVGHSIAELSAMRGCVKTLEWLAIKRWPLEDMIFGLAAKHGQVSVLEWAKGNGRVLNMKMLCVEATINKKPEVIEWLENNLDQIYSWAEASLRESLASSKHSAQTRRRAVLVHPIRGEGLRDGERCCYTGHSDPRGRPCGPYHFTPFTPTFDPLGDYTRPGRLRRTHTITGRRMPGRHQRRLY